jgi:hypothetical protein
VIDAFTANEPHAVAVLVGHPPAVHLLRVDPAGAMEWLADERGVRRVMDERPLRITAVDSRIVATVVGRTREWRCAALFAAGFYEFA